MCLIQKKNEVERNTPEENWRNTQLYYNELRRRSVKKIRENPKSKG